MNFTSYTSKQGDRWDLIAKKAYGDEKLSYMLIMANPDVIIEAEIPPGTVIYCPVYTPPPSDTGSPPWQSGEDDVEDNPDDVGTGIPIQPAPVVEFAFAAGYPKVVGNKIQFAVNKTGSYPWSIELVGFGNMAGSPLYPFQAGFPVTSEDFSTGGNYIVKVGNLTSGPVTVEGSANPLRFSQNPEFLLAGSVLSIRLAINKDGTYATKITKLSNGTVVYSAPYDYDKDQAAIFTVTDQDKYRIQVGTLTYDVEAIVTDEETEAPAWLTHAGLSYANDTRACSIWIGATSDVEALLERVDGQQITGVTSGNLEWKNGMYIPGTSEYVTSPYTEVFRFNPIVPNTGGVAPSVPHRLKVRRASSPQQVFVLVFTPPASIQNTPLPFQITTPTLAACKYGPFISGTPTFQDTYINFLFDADEVYRFKWRIKTRPSLTLVRDGVQPMTNSGGGPLFNPSNRPTVNFDKLAAGDYRFEIEGDNCDSSSYVQVRDFTITDTTIPPIVTGSVTPKIVTHGLPEQINITISGSSGNWLLNDTSTAETAPGSGYNNWVLVNGDHMNLGTGKLTNYVYQSNAPLRILKERIRSDINSLQFWDPTDPSSTVGKGYSRNNSIPLVIIVFNEAVV